MMRGVAERPGRKAWGGRRKGAGRKPELREAVSVTFDLERQDHERARAQAEREGISLASWIRAAVRTYLRGRRA
jgi:predicted HicB family RNase H-like nuclease